jgi:threonine dehydrogenase-like Zn-dependent dehydrogenase
MPTIATTAVVTAPKTLEFREVPVPALGPDEALVEVETNGVCGSDLELYEGSVAGYPLPIVMGHEPVGRIADIGPVARKRWQVGVGDRVVINSALRCGRCAGCEAADRCLELRTGYGTRSPELGCGLWGGFATHLLLTAESMIVPMSPAVDLAAVAFHNPLANGFQWSVTAGGVGVGTTVLVIGAGPRGLACALAALYAGAADVSLAGLRQDASRLALATQMGVDHAITLATADSRELRDRLAAGRPSVVIDTTPRSAAAVRQALEAVADGGRVVVAGIKGPTTTLDLPIDTIVLRRLTVVGPQSKTQRSLEAAVRAVESGRLPLEKLTTRSYPLRRLEAAIEALRSTDPQRPLHMRVDPMT